MSAVSLSSSAFARAETRAVRRARFGESKRAGFVPSFQSRGVALDQKSRSSKNSAVLAGTRSAALSLSAKHSVSTSASALRVPSNCATRPQVKSCLEVFNAVSDSAGAEDQGMRSVPDKSQFNAAMRIPSTAMAKIGRQLGGGGAATLEKVSMDLSSSVQSVAAPKLSDGDNGGNNGGKINNGGGGGDGDEGDDDDWFDEEDGTATKEGTFL